MLDELALPSGALPLAFTIRRDVREDEEADLLRFANRMAGLREVVAAHGCAIDSRTAIRVERKDGTSPGEVLLRPEASFRPASMKPVRRLPLGVETGDGDLADELAESLEDALGPAAGDRFLVGEGTIIVVRDRTGDAIEAVLEGMRLRTYRLAGAR